MHAYEWRPFAAVVLLGLGLRELGFFARLRIPTFAWQVPSEWVRNRLTAPFVWGFFLGSGLATWMPNATFYGLLLLAVVLPFPSGVILMAFYGLTRAAPAVAAAITPRCSAEVALQNMWQLRLIGHALNGFIAVTLSVLLLLMSTELRGVWS